MKNKMDFYSNMKTTLLVIVGIIIIAVAISTSLIVFTNYEQFTNRNDSGNFNYQDTEPIFQDAYLDKTISQWQNENFDSLMVYHAIHGDLFFEELGSLVLKNEMLHELDRQNISIGDFNLKLHAGMTLTSLPPHVGFEAYVNSTDGKTYRLSGMTNQAKVNHPIHITELEFFDTSLILPVESILSKNNTINILQENGNNARVFPHNFVTYGNQDIVVNFKNMNLVPIRIQGDGDYQNPNWYGPTILPLTTASMTFDKPGHYEWHSRTIPLPGSIASDHMGGGEISIIGDDMDELSFRDRQQIGASILQNSEIPWSGMGSGNNDGITIGFNRAIHDALPNYREYYQERAEQLVPFEIPILLE